MVDDDQPPASHPFPAILDTGHNHNFAITPDHLRDWAGYDWRQLPLEPRVESKYHGVVVPHRQASLWLYANPPGLRDTPDLTVPPAQIELNGGLAVFGNHQLVGVADTTTLAGPRLPILGLRALTHNKAVVRIDAAARTVQLDVP